MNDKTQVVVKTYGTSWISSLIIALIVGAVGYLITSSIQGFIVGFVMVFLTEFIVLASLIPYVGIYFYWVWAIQLNQLLIGLGNFTTAQTATFTNLLIYAPLIYCLIVGIILFAVSSVVVTVFLGALIGAIFR